MLPLLSTWIAKGVYRRRAPGVNGRDRTRRWRSVSPVAISPRREGRSWVIHGAVTVTKKRKRAGRRTESEAEDSRRRILATARILFGRHGFDAVGVRDIAERAGTTHGLLRHHFGSKLGVWKAVVDATEAEYVAVLGPLLDQVGDGDVIEAAAQFLRSFTTAAARQPDMTRLLMHEGTSSGPRLTYVLGQLASAHRRLAPLLQALHARGMLTQFTSETLFHFLLFSASSPFALPALSKGLVGAEASPEAHAERLVQTLLGPELTSR